MKKYPKIYMDSTDTILHDIVQHIPEVSISLEGLNTGKSVD